MEEYSIKDVTRTFGLSRSSILYYEKLGIIHSKKNATNGYRIYSHSEINRLKECVSLKNMGYTIKEISDMFANKNRDLTKEIDMHLNKVNYQKEMQKAYLEQLTRLKEMSECEIGNIDVVEIPKYLYLHSGCESGYHEIFQSPESNLLIQSLPLTQFVIVFDDYADSNGKKTIGRCIEGKKAKLLFDNAHNIEWEKFGGGKYIRLVVCNDVNPFSHELKQKINDFISKNCLRISQTAYVFSMVPNTSEHLLEICIPII